MHVANVRHPIVIFNNGISHLYTTVTVVLPRLDTGYQLSIDKPTEIVHTAGTGVGNCSLHCTGVCSGGLQLNFGISRHGDGIHLVVLTSRRCGGQRSVLDVCGALCTFGLVDLFALPEV